MTQAFSGAAGGRRIECTLHKKSARMFHGEDGFILFKSGRSEGEKAGLIKLLVTASVVCKVSFRLLDLPKKCNVLADIHWYCDRTGV